MYLCVYAPQTLWMGVITVFFLSGTSILSVTDLHPVFCPRLAEKSRETQLQERQPYQPEAAIGLIEAKLSATDPRRSFVVCRIEKRKQ